jgi:hypothetical protein
VTRQERTIESRVLSRYPDIRRAVIESPTFTSWRRELRAINIDGEILYVRGGDMLRDEDQVIFEWAREHGLLTDSAIAAALAGGHHER